LDIGPPALKRRQRNNLEKALEQLAIATELIDELLPENFEPQSGTTGVNVRPAGNVGMQNVAFDDQNLGYTYDVLTTVDPTRSMQDANDAALENFFARPVKIAEYEWGTGTTLAGDFNPWQLFFENPRVINRVNNFKLLRANLHLKVLINGNGFHYGRAMMYYNPLDALDDLSSNAALVPEDLIGGSQKPHIFLNPTFSEGGEMRLPFFWPLNYMSIPSSDWRQMGRIYLRSINALKHANGASDKVTVSVFAWAENVALSVPTSRDINTLVPQSGFEKQSGIGAAMDKANRAYKAGMSEIDEANQTGIVSGPATALSKGAALLAPLTGPMQPFLTATSGALGALASLAKTQGYCKPVVTKNPDQYRPTPTGSLALTNVPEPIAKLTVDDKQELTIDPGISGIGREDQMEISSIARRESLLTTFTWPIGAPPETMLWNCAVQPQLFAQSGNAPNVAYHLTALAYAALPFKFWTGTINFRFQMVASSFHKGRLKVVYDPDYLDPIPEYNVNYLEVVDLAEKSDFTVSISNTQDVTLLRQYTAGVYDASDVWGPVGFPSKPRGNGVVGVYVVNELTTPNSTVDNDIGVNVYVSAGEDFEVFVPDEDFGAFEFKPRVGPAVQETSVEEEPRLVDETARITGFEKQSGVDDTSPDAVETVELDKPVDQESSTLALQPVSMNLTNLVYTGEAIRNFRTIAKRYNLHTSIGLRNATAQSTYGSYPSFPFLKGQVAGAVHTAGDGSRYNYCNTVMLHYLMCAFSGWRGSVRWKWIYKDTSNLPKNGSLYIQRQSIESGDKYSQASTNAFTGSDPKGFARAACIQFPDSPRPAGGYFGARGMAYASLAINPNAEFEMPYYSDLRFSPGKRENWTRTNQDCESYFYQWIDKGDQTTHYDIFCAAGEDFQTFFYTGPPRMYWYPDVPV